MSTIFFRFDERLLPMAKYYGPVDKRLGSFFYSHTHEVVYRILSDVKLLL